MQIEKKEFSSILKVREIGEGMHKITCDNYIDLYIIILNIEM